MRIHEVAQGSPEWFQARTGAITASMFSEVRKRLKSGPNKGDWSSAAHDYAFTLAFERLTGTPLDEGQYETWAQKRGHELEPEARVTHEFEWGLQVDVAGFIASECGRFGASADGLIEDEGGVEYKCFVAPSKLRTILLSGDISEHYDQIQGGMWLTGRQWWHFGLYCPTLDPIGKALTIFPIDRDESYIEALKEDLEAFDTLVEQYKELLANRSVAN